MPVRAGVPMLEIEALSLRYGGVRAVHDVSLRIEPGSRVALIGPNGAGKTSLLSLIDGQVRPTSGRLNFGGHDITHHSPYRRAHLGICRSFQITNLMPKLTVRAQATLACVRPGRFGWVGRRGHSHVDASDLLAEWGIPEGTWDRRPGELSYGQQRRLELALAMAGQPKVLLLDEPNVGLTGTENADLVRRIAKMDREIAVVMVAHDMDMVFGFAERVVVLQRGSVLVDGTPEQVRNDPQVAAVYFGTVDEEFR